MLKKIFVVLFVFIATYSFGQEGNRPGLLNFGVGAGDGFPVYASLEFDVHEDISVGPFVAFNLEEVNWFRLGVKGDYYFDRILSIPEKFDFYAGLSLGYAVGLNDNNGGVYMDLHVGGRWFWNEKWGLNVELGGYKTAGGLIGVSMKL